MNNICLYEDSLKASINIAFKRINLRKCTTWNIFEARSIIYLLRTDNGHCRPQSQSDAVAIAAVTVMLSIIYLLRTDTGDTVVCKNSVTIFLWQI